MRVPKVLCLGYSPMGKTQIPFKELDMKRKILALAAAAVLAAASVTGTIAYFTAEDTAHNVITTAGIDIAIEEWQETEQGLLPYPDKPVEIMPGTTVSKIALIRNDDEKAFIRAKFEIVVFDQDGNIMEIAEDELKNIIRIETGEKWTEKDGWYYYDEAVLTGEKTEPLFTEVHFDGPMMTNEYQNCKAEINVLAQAVQTAHNGETAIEALGWPED